MTNIGRLQQVIKNNKLIFIVVIVYAVLGVTNGELAVKALDNSSYYLIEMVQILPVIFMLTVAIDRLVPKEWIIKRLGSGAGAGGAILALVFGSISAGPIYAAFPIAKMLHKKGASVSNIAIILSAWAVIKVPMLANEAKFLGPKFMIVRWILTVALIFLISWLMKVFKVEIKYEDTAAENSLTINEDYCINCGMCYKKMPLLFEHRGNKAALVDEKVDVKNLSSKQRDMVNDTVSKCPAGAIILDV